jgi:CMP-N,N'-diacetyllegionaminic acid synthase
VYRDKKIVCFVLARSGSKGLPNKNIRLLGGKPLLAWPICAASQSKYIDKIYLSTDSNDYLTKGLKYGCDAFPLRSSEDSKDSSNSIDVLLNHIDYLEKKNEEYDYLLLLEPTSPLTESIDIDRAIEKLLNFPSCDSILGISKVIDHHPRFLLERDNTNKIYPYQQYVGHGLRRQDLSDIYAFDGSLYLSSVSSLKENKTFHTQNTIGYETEKYKSFEIDDITDFFILEALVHKKSLGLL